MFTSRNLVRALAFILALSVSTQLLGHGALPRNAPVERVLTNLRAFVEENPDNWQGHYRLGRVHALAFETNLDEVAVFEDRDEVPIPASDYWAEGVWIPRGEEPNALSEEQRVAHLQSAIESLNRAIELAPQEALPHLTLASVLEAGEEFRSRISVHPLVLNAKQDQIEPWYYDIVRELGSGEEAFERAQSLLPRPRYNRSWRIDEIGGLRDQLVFVLWQQRENAEDQRYALIDDLLAQDWSMQVEQEYFAAMCLGLPSDSARDYKPLWGSIKGWVSYEAAEGYLRRVKGRSPDGSERVRESLAKATIEAFDDLPRPGGITPIIFALDTPRPLDSLLAADTTVSFDLDGTGRDQRWPWLRPDAAILCWDPENTGKITSGRQLFGSVTWWILFPDGYRALDALDDNRDGKLSGDELIGLAIWQDANSNGVSDPGEVRPIDKVGIEAISVVSDTTAGGGPACHAGLRMTDGRTLPTYDWVVSPIQEDSATDGTVTEAEGG